jgi:hypothetical protein
MDIAQQAIAQVGGLEAAKKIVDNLDLVAVTKTLAVRQSNQNYDAAKKISESLLPQIMASKSALMGAAHSSGDPGGWDMLVDRLVNIKKAPSVREQRLIDEGLSRLQSVGSVTTKVADGIRRYTEKMVEKPFRLCSSSENSSWGAVLAKVRGDTEGASKPCMKEEVEKLFYNEGVMFGADRKLAEKCVCKGCFVQLPKHGLDPVDLHAQQMSYRVYTMQSSSDKSKFYCADSLGLYDSIQEQAAVLLGREDDASMSLFALPESDILYLNDRIPNPIYESYYRNQKENPGLQLPSVSKMLSASEIKHIINWRMMTLDVEKILANEGPIQLTVDDISTIKYFAEQMTPTSDIASGDRSWAGRATQSLQNARNSVWDFVQEVPGVGSTTRYVRKLLMSPSEFVLVYFVLAIFRSILCLFLHYKVTSAYFGEDKDGHFYKSQKNLIISTLCGKFFENIGSYITTIYHVLSTDLLELAGISSSGVSVMDGISIGKERLKGNYTVVTMKIVEWLGMAESAEGSGWLTWICRKALAMQKTIAPNTVGSLDVANQSLNFWSEFIGIGTGVASAAATIGGAAAAMGAAPFTGGASMAMYLGMAMTAGKAGWSFFQSGAAAYSGAQEKGGDFLSFGYFFSLSFEVLTNVLDDWMTSAPIPGASLLDFASNPGSMGSVLQLAFGEDLFCAVLFGLTNMVKRISFQTTPTMMMAKVTEKVLSVSGATYLVRTGCSLASKLLPAFMLASIILEIVRVFWQIQTYDGDIKSIKSSGCGAMILRSITDIYLEKLRGIISIMNNSNQVAKVVLERMEAMYGVNATARVGSEAYKKSLMSAIKDVLQQFYKIDVKMVLPIQQSSGRTHENRQGLVAQVWSILGSVANKFYNLASTGKYDHTQAFKTSSAPFDLADTLFDEMEKLFAINMSLYIEKMDEIRTHDQRALTKEEIDFRKTGMYNRSKDGYVPSPFLFVTTYLKKDLRERYLSSPAAQKHIQRWLSSSYFGAAVDLGRSALNFSNVKLI